MPQIVRIGRLLGGKCELNFSKHSILLWCTSNLWEHFHIDKTVLAQTPAQASRHNGPLQLFPVAPDYVYVSLTNLCSLRTKIMWMLGLIKLFTNMILCYQDIFDYLKLWNFLFEGFSYFKENFQTLWKLLNFPIFQYFILNVFK